MITMVKTDDCPHCDDLYAKLCEAGQDFDALDAGTPDGMAELALTGLDPQSIALPLVLADTAEERKLVQQLMREHGILGTLKE